MTHRDENAQTTTDPKPAMGGELTLADLYLQAAGARAATIERFLWQADALPEPMAETLILAAVGIENAIVTAGLAEADCDRVLLVAALLTAEARRRDPRADEFAERALDELDHGDDVTGVAFRRETADSLAWACAVLRLAAIDPRSAADAAYQLELAAMCVRGAADLIAAADRATIFEAGRQA
jgi:hypothetical protein